MESVLGPREGKATLYSTGPRLVMIMGFWLCLGIWLRLSFLACSIQFRSERFGVDHFGLWTEASKQQQQKRLVVQSSQPLTASTPLQNQSMFHRQKLLFRLAWWLVVCLIALPPTLAKHRKARWFCSFLLPRPWCGSRDWERTSWPHHSQSVWPYLFAWLVWGGGGYVMLAVLYIELVINNHFGFFFSFFSSFPFFLVSLFFPLRLP